MLLKADFHIHTAEDPKDNIWYDAYKLCDVMSEYGYRVISITNHETVTWSQELNEYAVKRGILLIPGIEATIESRHVVIINPQPDICEIETFKELAEYKKTHPDIFIIAVHPFYPSFKCLGNKLIEHIELFDAVEYSHFYFGIFNYFNNLASRVAERYDKGLISTSDSHSLKDIDKNYILIDSDHEITSVLSALKSRKYRMISEPLPFYKVIGVFIPGFVKRIVRQLTMT